MAFVAAPYGGEPLRIAAGRAAIRRAAEVDRLQPEEVTSVGQRVQVPVESVSSQDPSAARAVLRCRQSGLAPDASLDARDLRFHTNV